MEMQSILPQLLPWLTCLLTAAFGLWSASGTLWRGGRTLIFVYAAYAIAHQHQMFITTFLKQFVPSTSLQTLQDVVLAFVTVSMFMFLIILHTVLWQPEPVAGRSTWQRVASGLCGASAGWLLGVVIILGTANAAHLSLNTTSDQSRYFVVLQQSATLLNESIAPLMP